jgi:DivIVA domain-containing protein
VAAARSEETIPADADRIREAKFATVRRGYDPAQVLEYLNGVADRVQSLENDVRRYQAELGQARTPLDTALLEQERRDPYDAVSTRVAELVRAFDQDVDRLRKEAEDEANRIVTEAKNEAERIQREIDSMRQESKSEMGRMLTEGREEANRIRFEAQARAERLRLRAEEMLRDARAEADRTVSDLKPQRDKLVGEIRAMRNGIIDVAEKLGAFIDADAREKPVVEAGDADQVASAAWLVSSGAQPQSPPKERDRTGA